MTEILQKKIHHKNFINNEFQVNGNVGGLEQKRICPSCKNKGVDSISWNDHNSGLADVFFCSRRECHFAFRERRPTTAWGGLILEKVRKS